jgi:hypothetical protein
MGTPLENRIGQDVAEAKLCNIPLNLSLTKGIVH